MAGQKFCIDCRGPIRPQSQRCIECASKVRRKYPRPNFCIDCGEEIGPTATRCRSCKAKYLVAVGKMKPRKFKAGNEHPGWKGGRARTAQGYILIKKPAHPRADHNGYVREHILVWEEAHGKPLPEGWIVHHLNGIKDNNRPKNLVGLPNRKHYLVLQAKAKRIQELEGLLNNRHQLL